MTDPKRPCSWPMTLSLILLAGLSAVATVLLLLTPPPTPAQAESHTVSASPGDNTARGNGIDQGLASQALDGVRPFAVPLTVVEAVEIGDCFTFNFKNCGDYPEDPCLIFDDLGYDIGQHGGWLVASIHYFCSALLTIFLAVHLYLITFGDSPGYGLRSMFDGRHRSHRRD